MSQTILITGCSSGIGWCAAQTLHKKGYRVFATARKDTDLEKLRAAGIESVQMDMEDAASIAAGLAQVLEKTGGTLDALFNNAGFAVPGAVEDLTLPMLRKQFETNVFGPIELTNRVIPVMRKQGHGRIIMNTSILGIITMPYRGAYNASKFALEGFSNTLRQELHGTSISVSIIAPGPVMTHFRENANKNYQENLQDKSSIHKNAYLSMEKNLSNMPKSEKMFTESPDKVIEKLLHALESKSPDSRYYVGVPAHLFAFLRRILPDAALDWVVALSLRGDQT
jgi:NAD(P)-dependent dehydrogenase (short-subunit alcohol dehydrogenase family)